jgi:DNA invertase Pin-like site-specific DNA recombinase
MFLTNLALFAKIEKKLLVGRVRNKLGAIKKDVKEKGYHVTQKGKNKGRVITKLGSDTWTVEQLERAGKVAGEQRTAKAKANAHNIFFYKFITNYEKNHGRIDGKNKVERVVKELNFLDAKTSTGMAFTVPRYYSMRKKCNAIFISNEVIL